MSNSHGLLNATRESGRESAVHTTDSSHLKLALQTQLFLTQSVATETPQPKLPAHTWSRLTQAPHLQAHIVCAERGKCRECRERWWWLTGIRRDALSHPDACAFSCNCSSLSCAALWEPAELIQYPPNRLPTCHFFCLCKPHGCCCPTAVPLHSTRICTHKHRHTHATK